MKELDFSLDAREDLRGIYIYTLEKWGQKQADNYINSLEGFCLKINANEIITKSYYKKSVYPKFAFYKQDYIIFFYEDDISTQIIALFGTRMDIPNRLIERLS